MARDGRDDVLGDLAAVEGVGALARRWCAGSRRRPGSSGPCRPPSACRPPRRNRRVRPRRCRPGISPATSRPLSRGEIGEALLGQLDRGLEQPRPGQLAPFLVRGLEQAQACRARRPSGRRRPRRRTSSACRPRPRKRSGVAAAGAVSRPSSVLTARLASSQWTMKAPPPSAGALRLDEVEDELHRDRRIDRAAAGAQDLAPRRGGERVGRRHHVFLRRPERTDRAAGRRLGRRRERLGESMRRCPEDGRCKQCGLCQAAQGQHRDSLMSLRTGLILQKTCISCTGLAGQRETLCAPRLRPRGRRGGGRVVRPGVARIAALHVRLHRRPGARARSPAGPW